MTHRVMVARLDTSVATLLFFKTRTRARMLVRTIRGPLLLFLSYYLAARIGFALQSPVVPQSVLWLPNTILLSALLLAPSHQWPLYLAAAFPAQIAVGLLVNERMLPLILLYVTNCLDAALGAYLVRRVIGARLVLNKLRNMIALLILTGLATFLLSFADAGLTIATDWHNEYWPAWSTRVRTNLLSNVVLVPAILGLYEIYRQGRRNLDTRNLFQAVCLIIATIDVAFFVFLMPVTEHMPVMLYITMPLILIGAVHVGVGVTALQLLIITLVGTWSVVRGLFVFTHPPSDNDVLALQLFLFAMSVPMLCLASVVAERRNTAIALRASARRAKRQFVRLSTIYRSSPVGLAFVDRDLYVVSTNRSMVELCGGQLPVTGRRNLEISMPGLATQLKPLIQRVLNTGTAVVGQEVIISRPSPERPRLCLATCDPVHDASEELIGVNIAIQDVTTSKRAEQALITSREKLRESYARRMDLAGRLISAQEAERTRIARELHDDISQRLAELSMSLSALQSRLADNRTSVRGEVNEMRRRSADLAAAVRDLSHDLHPGVLQHAGLVAALKSRCADFAQKQGIEVRCDADDIGELRDDVSLSLYRIAQEGLSNIARHANARRVHVRLIRTASLIQLSVSDDGQGFDPAHATRNVGLFSAEERARLVRGRVFVESAAGGGTVLRATIPLHEAEVTKS